jgi:hypothetical protein
MSAFRAKEDITFAARMFATELVPGAKKVAMLGQASNRSIASVFRSVQNAAKSRDISVHLLEAA